MAQSPSSILEDRRDQRFPILKPEELNRLRRFGHPRAFAKGEALVKVGQTGHGLTLILIGEVAVSQRDQLGHTRPIITYGPGSFMGVLCHLTGRPALTEAYAQARVESFII